MADAFLISLLANISTELGKKYIRTILPKKDLTKELESAYTNALKKWGGKNHKALRKKERERVECESLILELYRGTRDISSIDSETQELISLFETELYDRTTYPLANEFFNQKKNKELFHIQNTQTEKLNQIANSIKKLELIINSKTNFDYSKLFRVIRSDELQPEDILQPFRCRESEGYSDVYFSTDREYLDDTLVKQIVNGKNILVTGVSYSGKSRSIYEALRKQSTNVVIPEVNAFSNEEVYNIDFLDLKTNCVWVFDDIDSFVDDSKQGKILFATFVQNLINNPASSVVATC